EGLERLPNLIRQGTRILAVLGPCVMCKARKARLVKTLLRLREPIITDLVIDAPSAEEVVADLSGEGRGARPDTPGGVWRGLCLAVGTGGPLAGSKQGTSGPLVATNRCIPL